MLQRSHATLPCCTHAVLGPTLLEAELKHLLITLTAAQSSANPSTGKEKGKNGSSAKTKAKGTGKGKSGCVAAGKNVGQNVDFTCLRRRPGCSCLSRQKAQGILR